jgi:hypothetical protein
MRTWALLAVAVCLPGQETPTATFGTTVASTSGLRGNLYLLRKNAERLPNFKRLKPVGTIYTTALQIWPRSFQQGFPGITDRFEWFAIDYNGRIWVEKGGRYAFRLLADDGAKLSIDDSMIIDNDGVHAPLSVEGSALLSRGVHQIRVSYFQGPRDFVALVLSIAGPDNRDWRIFDTNHFQPPPDPKDWIPGKISKIQRGANW